MTLRGGGATSTRRGGGADRAGGCEGPQGHVGPASEACCGPVGPALGAPPPGVEAFAAATAFKGRLRARSRSLRAVAAKSLFG